jgi:hypothetical protein
MQQLKTEYTSLWESYQQVQLKYNKIYDERVRAWLARSNFHAQPEAQRRHAPATLLKLKPGTHAFATDDDIANY